MERKDVEALFWRKETKVKGETEKGIYKGNGEREREREGRAGNEEDVHQNNERRRRRGCWVEHRDKGEEGKDTREREKER